MVADAISSIYNTAGLLEIHAVIPLIGFFHKSPSEIFQLDL